jgi:hypothetical protein
MAVTGMIGSLTDRRNRVPVVSWAGWATAGIVAVAFAIRCVRIDGHWLTGDEIWSATLSKDGPWTALLSSARFDVHPPLYHLQLSLWMMLGHSDQWLMLNAIAWSTAAVALLIYTASEFYGPRIGLAAGAMLAVAPASLAYADEVHIYGMLLALIVLVWYTQTRWLNGTSGRLGAFWMIASQCAVAYAHGAGLVMLSGCVLLGAATPSLRKDWRLLRRWIAIEAVVGLLVAPTIVVGLMRGVNHPAIPGFGDFVQTWTFLATGQPTLDAAFVACGAILLAVLAVGAAVDREAALQTAMLVFAPLVLAGLVSHLYKPMWLDRIFTPVIPFLCLGLVRATLERGRLTPGARWLGTGCFAVLVLGWLGVGVTDQFTRTKGDGFKPAAAAVHQLQRPGDLIVVGPNYTYWYFLWYYAGPRWGEPLHAFILNADWQRMMARLPPALVAVFGMSEADRTLQIDGATVILWDPDRPLPKTSGDVIIVGLRELSAIKVPGYRLAESKTETQLIIERWTPGN